MLFNSIEFLIFLPITFLLYWLIPHKFRWVILLVASYVFYMYWNWKLVFLIVFTTLVSYSCGLLLEKYFDKVKIKRLIIAVTLIACLGILLFFKYFNFFFEILKDIVNLFGDGNILRGTFTILLPVGISFYTFQTLSYVIDVYKGTIKAEKHIGYYALFVSFFPQLVAGPIERPNDLLPQLRAKRDISEVDFVSAFKIMLIGFFKKIAVADIIGIFVNNTYNDISSSTGLMVFVSTILFAFQIYCDFSGYSDIAVGCAKLFGVNLTENFQSPYVSKSIKEFWNRWHISLSRWLRDYIYFPLGGSRVKKWRWALNIFIVFLISGLWHGANYTFLIWGVLHGLYQIVGGLTHKLRNSFWTKLKVNPEGKVISALRTVATFLLVTFAWIFFRANSVGDAFIAISKIFSDYSFNGEYWQRSISGLGLTVFFVVFIVLSVPFMLTLEKLKSKDSSCSVIYKYSAVRCIAYVLMAWLTVSAWIYLQASDIGSSFIYFQF